MKQTGLLYLGNHLAQAGATRQQCEELVPRLRAAGWKVLTASSIRNRAGRLLDMVWTAWHRRAEYEIAIVDVFSGPAFLWADVCSRVLAWLGKSQVLVLHGGGLPAFAAKHGSRVQRLLKRATHVVAPSSYLLASMTPYAHGIRLLPNGLELSAYSPRASGPVASRLVWLRAFSRLYNPTLAVEVIARLKGEFPDLQLLMVGPRKDKSFEDARRRAEELGVASNVQFLDAVPKTEVPLVLRRADIFINTTNVDNAPVSVLEALACGLCVVSTNVGGLPYLLSDGADALLVPPEDAEGMAGAVRRLLRDADLAARLSANGRTRAFSHDWSIVVPQWNELLQQTARGPT